MYNETTIFAAWLHFSKFRKGSNGSWWYCGVARCSQTTWLCTSLSVKYFWAIKSSKYPQDAPTLVIFVKYPTVCVTSLCRFSLALLILCGRWSHLPSHCRAATACPSSLTQKARQWMILCTSHNRAEDLDRMLLTARWINMYVNNSRAISHMQTSPSFTQCAQPDKWCKWCTGPPTWSVISFFGWNRCNRKGPHQRDQLWTSNHQESFLSFSDDFLLRSMSLSGNLCLGWDWTGGLSNRKALIAFCFFFFNACVCMRLISDSFCGFSGTSVRCLADMWYFSVYISLWTQLHISVSKRCPAVWGKSSLCQHSWLLLDGLNILYTGLSFLSTILYVLIDTSEWIKTKFWHCINQCHLCCIGVKEVMHSEPHVV